MCITTCPNEFISGVGLNPYFSAGIESEAATIFFSYRVNWLFTIVVTGFATGPGAASCATHIAPVTISPAITNPIRFMVFPLPPSAFRALIFQPAVVGKHAPAPHERQATFIAGICQREFFAPTSPQPCTVRDKHKLGLNKLPFPSNRNHLYFHASNHVLFHALPA